MPTLATYLDAVTAGPRPDLVLGLRPVSVVDRAGLGVLCRAPNRARARRGRLRLVTDSTRFLRILRCTGLTGSFDNHPKWPEGLAGTSAAWLIFASAG
ncbi:STAS domain-containing protein [Streptomyces sp. NPDC002265]|uniref:STAS domain-containing protein n=1 Tax=Streptomyces sp. NPDC002265 TaxID=3154415 RepID=UPI003323D506